MIPLLLLVSALAVGPASAADPPEPTGWMGVVYNVRDAGARVKMVLPGTPAEEVGLRPGDVMLSVDGVDLAGLDMEGMRVALSGEVGSTALLRVRRGEGEIELSLVRMDRPTDERVAEMRMEAELANAPPQRRAAVMLGALPDDAGVDRVVGIWQRFLDERGEVPVPDSLVNSVLRRLAGIGSEAAIAAGDEVVDLADGHLGGVPRYQRLVAEYYASLEPARHDQAVRRIRRALVRADADHPEHPRLQRSLARSLLAMGEVDGAVAASEAALQTWNAPTLIWVGLDGVEQARLVVDGSSPLARLAADCRVAVGDEAGAREVLVQMLAHRHEPLAAEQLVGLGGEAPPPPRPLGELRAEPFPAFDLPSLTDDSRVGLGDLAGRPTLIAMWASWCAPCKSELAHLAEHHAAFGAAGVNVVAIAALDKGPAARSAAQAGGWPFPALFDEGRVLTDALVIGSVPRTYLLDRDGMLVASYQGWSETSAREQVAILQGLARGEQHAPHLLEVESGDEHLALEAFFPLPQARALAWDGEQVLVATRSGRVMPIGEDGPDEGAVRESPIRLQGLDVLDGAWLGLGKKRAVMLPADGEAVLLGTDRPLLAAAAVGDRVVVAPGGRARLEARDLDGNPLWKAGDLAVTWALVPLDDGRLARVMPGQLQVLDPDGLASAPVSLPAKASGAAAVHGGLVISSSLEQLTQADLDGDGTPETVVLLDSRHVLGLSIDREILFRFSLPVDGDVLCADTDGDGRAEIWVASPPAGVGRLGWFSAN